MIISQVIKKYHKNRIISIQKMQKGMERDLAIGALVADLGKRAITGVANAIGCCFRKVKKCFILFTEPQQISLFEFRGRKKVEDKFPEIRNQIKDIVSTYEYTDSHFKTETLFVDLSLQNLRNKLIEKYGYTEETCPCRSTLLRILTDLGYKIQKIKKTKVLDKIPETDAIFENINKTKQFISLSGKEVAVISIDDKNRKKIGNISDNGFSWVNREALNHDTNFICLL